PSTPSAAPPCTTCCRSPSTSRTAPAWPRSHPPRRPPLPRAPAPPHPPPRARGAPLSLSTTFRSGPRILALANSVIDRIPEERRGGTSLVARPGAPDGEVRAALLADPFAQGALVAAQGR